MPKPPSMLTLPIFTISEALDSKSESITRLSHFKENPLKDSLPAARFDAAEASSASMSRSSSKEALDSIDVSDLNLSAFVPRARRSNSLAMR